MLQSLEIISPPDKRTFTFDWQKKDFRRQQSDAVTCNKQRQAAWRMCDAAHAHTVTWQAVTSEWRVWRWRHCDVWWRRVYQWDARRAWAMCLLVSTPAVRRAVRRPSDTPPRRTSRREPCAPAPTRTRPRRPCSPYRPGRRDRPPRHSCASRDGAGSAPPDASWACMCHGAATDWPHNPRRNDRTVGHAASQQRPIHTFRTPLWNRK